MDTHNLHPFTRMLGITCYFMTILFLVEQFYPSKILIYIYSIIGFVLFVCAFIAIRKLNRIIVFSLILIGSISFYIEGFSVPSMMIGFGKNVHIMALFILIPLIGTFLSSSGYLSILKEKVQKKERDGEMNPYRFSYFLTASMGILLNYGSMAIVKHISEGSFTDYKNKKMTLNIMRAFGFCLLWSPYFVNIGLILSIFHLSWFEIGGYGLMMGGIYLVISWLLFKKISFEEDPAVLKNKRVESATTHKKSLIPFYLFAITLIILSFLFDYISEVSMISIVSLLAIVLPLIWSIFTKVFPSFIYDVWEQMQHSFAKLKNELAVFISAGYLGMALSQTNAGYHISNVLFDISIGSALLLSIFIMIFFIVFAQVGIHPVILLTAIGTALSPAKFGVTPEYLAIILIIAFVSSTQMSPFSGQVLMASQLMQQPVTTIIKQNILFSLCLAVILTLFVYSLLLVGWI